MSAVSPERLFLYALPGLSNNCRFRTAITPFLLQELTGPCQGLVPHLSRCFKRLLKDARAGRQAEPDIVASCDSFCGILYLCCEQTAGTGRGTDTRLQCLAQESLEAVRASSLEVLLEAVREAGGG